MVAVRPNARVSISAGSLAWATIAVLLGAATHILWDGFTHRDAWPARLLFSREPIEIGPFQLTTAKLLQHLSSVIGSAIVLGYAALRYRSLEPSAPVRGARFVLPILTLGILAGIAIRLRYPSGGLALLLLIIIVVLLMRKDGKIP